MPLPEHARERLAARAREIARTRRRVAAATLATFALAWGVIASTGSMGVTTTASTQAASTTSSSVSTDSSTSSSTGDSSDAVTTTQS
jgi:hypothetical protein